MQELQGQELYDYIAQCVPFISAYTQPGKNIQRKDIYTQYMLDVEGEASDTNFKSPDTCGRCGSSNIIHDHALSDNICQECGSVEYILSEEIGFKEEQEIDKNIFYAYDRKTHFNEWITQFQGKESTSVPQEVYDQLRSEFKKQKIQSLAEITHGKVRTLLKKLRMNKYYENVPYITSVLNGLVPPRMPQALEDQLRLMFIQIQVPFNKHCPADRKNFLSYSYVLYKFCELLGKDEYLPYFPLLKSKEKLYKQDQIWSLICKDLSWEYIKTI
jgi:ribosomal protein S27AE